MKVFITIIAIGVFSWGLVAIADSKPAETPEVASAQTKLPVFRPRERGAPATRIGGATRGAESVAVPALEALAPESVGFTRDAQPVLYWYVSEATDLRVDFTLLRGGATEPTVERTLASPKRGGVQRIDLAELGVTLEPGVAYVWTVALVADPDRRAADRIAGGAIERLADTAELETLNERLGAEQRDRQVFVFAEAGLWYDAVRSATERIGAGPDGGLAREQRAALLEQVGLETLARRTRDQG